VQDGSIRLQDLHDRWILLMMWLPSATNKPSHSTLCDKCQGIMYEQSFLWIWFLLQTFQHVHQGTYVNICYYNKLCQCVFMVVVYVCVYVCPLYNKYIYIWTVQILIEK
jgi:hypothetical protein